MKAANEVDRCVVPGCDLPAQDDGDGPLIREDLAGRCALHRAPALIFSDPAIATTWYRAADSAVGEAASAYALFLQCFGKDSPKVEAARHELLATVERRDLVLAASTSLGELLNGSRRHLIRAPTWTPAPDPASVIACARAGLPAYLAGPFYCAGLACPGLGFKASHRAHPKLCLGLGLEPHPEAEAL